MATYTDANSIKLISTGDEAGTWGDSTNVNLQILDRAANGFVQIALTGTTYNLTTDDQPSSAQLGHYKAIEFTGTPGGTCTVTIQQNDQPKVYMILNSTNQSVTLTQGSGSNVTIVASRAAIVIADGAGSGAAVTDLTAEFVAGNYEAGSIDNADINASAAIADTKLATISTASKVSNSATTATSSNTNSAIVARDGSGNFSAGTITANLVGNISKTGDITLDASGDIILDAQGNDIRFKDGGTLRGSLDIGTANTIKVKAGSSEELRVTTSGLNVVNGLRVGDTTTPTDNDIHAVADISAGGELKLTSGSSDWTFEVGGSNQLIIQYGGTTKFTVDSSGNVTASGTGLGASTTNGDVGTYVLAGGGNNITDQWGDTEAGSNLTPAAFRYTGAAAASSYSSYYYASQAESLSGTWRRMGGYHPSYPSITLFVRIS